MAISEAKKRIVIDNYFKKECDVNTSIKEAFIKGFELGLKKAPIPQPKMGHCKDCKWWKDSDGVYRRGVGAESQCPINHKEVYDGKGYCFLFKSQESEGKE